MGGGVHPIAYGLPPVRNPDLAPRARSGALSLLPELREFRGHRKKTGRGSNVQNLHIAYPSRFLCSLFD